MLLALQVILAALSLASAVYYAFCAWATWRHFGTRVEDPPISAPPVSVLITVCGLEDRAEEKWSSFCRQDYPEYEVLFGVRDPADPAAPLLRALERQFPERVRCVIGQRVLGTNYQVSNALHLYRTARHPLVVITDSDMRAEPHYVRTVTAPLHDPAVGLVTCGYKNNRPRSLGAALATLGRCLDFIPQVLLARLKDGRMRFALGATLATRRDVLERIGGLEGVVNRIGSDYHLGYRIAEEGYRVVLSSYVIENDAGPEAVGEVYQRELRWARTSRMNRGPEYYGVGLTHGTFYSALLLAAVPGAAWAAGVFAAVWGLRLLQSALTLGLLGARPLLAWFWALPLRDLMSFAVWFHSILGDDVRWRGRRLKLRPGGVLEEPGPRAAARHETGGAE